jgi:hypothetical protein
MRLAFYLREVTLTQSLLNFCALGRDHIQLKYQSQLSRENLARVRIPSRAMVSVRLAFLFQLITKIAGNRPVLWGAFFRKGILL